MGSVVAKECEDDSEDLLNTTDDQLGTDEREKFEYHKLVDLFGDISKVSAAQFHKLTSDDEINLITCYDAFAIWLNSRSQSGDQKISADQLLDFLSVHKVSHNLTYQLFNAADLEGTGLVSVSALLDLIKDGHWAHLNELSSVVKRLGKTSLLLGPVDIFGDFDRSEVSNHASQIFQFLQYHQPSPMVFSQFPYQLHDHLVSIRLRLLHSWYAAAQPQAAAKKLDLKGSEVTSDDKIRLRPTELCYSDLTVSSNKSEISLFADLNPNTYWQSDGQARSHWIRAKIKKGVIITAIHLGVNIADSSYMPKTIGIAVGKTANSKMSELYKVTVPFTVTGEFQLLSTPLDQHYSYIQLNILGCYSDGCDCRVRSLRFEGYRVALKSSSRPNLLVDRGINWYLDILTSTVEVCALVTPSLRQTVIQHSLVALRDLEPLALSQSKLSQSGVSPLLLEKVQKFLKDISFIPKEDNESTWYLSALECLTRMALTRGSLAATFEVAIFALDKLSGENQMGIGPIATQLVKLMNESLCELGKKTTEEKAIGYDPIEGEMDLWDFLTELLNYFPLVIRMEEVHRRNTTVVDFNGLTAKLITDGCDKVFSQKTADMDKLSRMQLSYLELMRLVISRGKLIKVETIEESNRLFQLLKGLISRDNGSVALSAYQILLDSAELSVPSEETRGTKFLELLELRPNFTPVCESDTNSLVFFSLCRYWTHQSPRKLFDDSDLFIAYLEKIFKLVVERMLSRLQNVTLLEESPLEDVRDEVFFCLVHSHLFSAVSFTRLLKDSGLTDNMLLQLSKFVANHWDALTDALEKMGNEQMLKKVNVPLGGLFTSIFTFAFGLLNFSPKKIPLDIGRSVLPLIMSKRNCLKMLSSLTLDELMSSSDKLSDGKTIGIGSIESEHPNLRHCFHSKMFEAIGGRHFQVTFDDETELANGDTLEIHTTTGYKRRFQGKVGTPEWPKTLDFHSCDRLIFSFNANDSNVSWGYKCAVKATGCESGPYRISWQADFTLTFAKFLGAMIGSCIRESPTTSNGDKTDLKRKLLLQSIFGHGKLKKISDETKGQFNVAEVLLSEEKFHYIQELIGECESKTKVTVVTNDQLAQKCFAAIFAGLVWHLDCHSQLKDTADSNEISDVLLCLYVDSVAAMKKILRKRQELAKSDEPNVEVKPEGTKYVESCLDRAKLLFNFIGVRQDSEPITQGNSVARVKKRMSRSLSSRRRTSSADEIFQLSPICSNVSALVRPLLNFIVDDSISALSLDSWLQEEQLSRDATQVGWDLAETFLVNIDFEQPDLHRELLGIMFLRKILLSNFPLTVPGNHESLVKLISMIGRKLSQIPITTLSDRENLLFIQHREFLRIALFRIATLITEETIDISVCGQLLPIILEFLGTSGIPDEFVPDPESLWSCQNRRMALKNYTESYAWLLTTGLIAKISVSDHSEPLKNLLDQVIMTISHKLVTREENTKDFSDASLELKRLCLLSITARFPDDQALGPVLYTSIDLLKSGSLSESHNDFLVCVMLGKLLQRCSPELADSICNRTSKTPVEGVSSGLLTLQFLFTFGCQSFDQKDLQWSNLIVQICQNLRKTPQWRIAVEEFLSLKVAAVMCNRLKSTLTDLPSAIFTLMTVVGFPNAACAGKYVGFRHLDQWSKGVLVKVILETGNAMIVDMNKREVRTCRPQDYCCLSEIPTLTGIVDNVALLMGVYERILSNRCDEDQCNISDLPALLLLYCDALILKAVKVYAAEVSSNRSDLYSPDLLSQLVKLAGKRTSFNVGCQLGQLEVLSLKTLSMRNTLGSNSKEMPEGRGESPTANSDGTITEPAAGPNELDDGESDDDRPAENVQLHFNSLSNVTMLEAALEAAVWLNILFDEEKKQEICAQVNPLMHVRDVGLRLRPSSNSVELPPMEQLIEAGQKGVSKDCSRCLYSLFENHSNDCKQRDYEDIKESNDSQPLHVLASKNSKTGLQQVETSISFTSAVLQSHLILLARDLLNILIANWPTQLDLWPEKFELNDWAELAALLDLLSTTPGINQKFEATLARVFHVGLEQTYLSDASEFLRSMAVVGCQFLLEASGQRHSTLEFSRTDGTAEVVRVNLSGATFCSVALEGFNGGKLVLATSADFISHRMEFDGKKVKKTNGKLKGILLEGDEVWLEYTSPSQSRSGAVTVHLDGHVVGRFSLGYELLLLSFSALESGKSNLISSIPLDTVIKSLVSAVLGSFGDRQLKIIGLLVKLAKFLLERPAEDFAQKPNLHEFASLWRLYDAAKKAMGSDLYTTVKPRLSRALVDFLYLVENLAIKWGQESDLASVVMPSAPLDKCYAQAIRSIAFITAAVNYPCQAQTLARLSSFCNGTTLTPFSSD